MLNLTDSITKEIATIEKAHNTLAEVLPNIVTPAFRAFSESADPQALAAALGTDAGQVFLAFEKILELSAIVGCTMPVASGEWQPQPDGTVTYTPAPEPEPSED